MVNMDTYQQTVGELAEAARGIPAQPPELNAREEIESYCRTLRLTPKEQRHSEMQRKVRTVVEKGLQQWRLSVEHAPSLLVKLHNTMEQIEADKSEREQAIETSKAKLRDLDFEKERLRDRAKKLERSKENEKPPSQFEQTSYRMLIIGSLLVGILTAWYYLGMQVQMQAARVGDTVTSTLEFLGKHPEESIYLFGVVIFLLAGKIVSVLHARLEHPKWLFLTIGIAAVTLTVSTVLLIANVSSLQQNITNTDTEIKNNNPKTLFGDVMDCASEQYKKLEKCIKNEELNKKRSDLVKEIASQGFWMTILVMMSEIFLGSVAWMLASEYHAKHGASQLNAQKLQSLLEQEKLVDTQIQEQKELQSRGNRDRLDADRLGHQLQQLKAVIPSREHIERSAMAVFEHELDHGKEILNNLEIQWAEDNAKLRSAT